MICLTILVEYYLPKKESLNVAFFQDLITGTKSVFKND